MKKTQDLLRKSRLRLRSGTASEVDTKSEGGYVTRKSIAYSGHERADSLNDRDNRPSLLAVNQSHVVSKSTHLSRTPVNDADSNGGFQSKTARRLMNERSHEKG